MNIAAFQPLNCFSFAGDMGSQAKLVRDSTSDPTHAWFVLTYSSNRDDGFGDDFVNVRAIHLDQIGSSVGTCGAGIIDDPTDTVHVVLPAGETSFTNTGTHYVDPNGRLLISSSERWAHDRGDPFGYESRVDECQ